MKKRITKILSIMLVIAMVFSTYTISPTTVKGNTTDVKNDFEWNMYEHCSKIENAEKGKDYILEITNDKPIYVVEYTAEATEKLIFACDYLESDEEQEFDGYGYFFEGDDETEGKLLALIDCAANTDWNADVIDYIGVDASDFYNYDMPGFEKEVKKGKKYYFVFRACWKGEGGCVFRIECAHKNTIVKNKDITSCEQGGYTGDLYCKDCDKLLSEGYEVEAGTEHDYVMDHINATCISTPKIKNTCMICGNVDEIEESNQKGDHCYVSEGYVAPTCTKSGQSGTSKCKYCGDVKYENYELKPYHEQFDEDGHNINCTYEQNLKVENCMVDGYTGDYACRYCGEVYEEGQKITAAGHSFVDGVCEECGVKEDLLPIGEDGAYEISSYEDLKLFMENARRGIKGRLTNDIIIPVIDEEDRIYRELKDSELYGDGHTIKNWDVGILGYSFYNVDNSYIENITFEVSGDVSNYKQFGVITRYASRSTFKNITVKGKIENSKSAEYIGAIAGKAYDSEFINCTNEADIKYTSGEVGGIVGLIGGDSLIKDCTNNGSITGEALQHRRGGGIAGYCYVVDMEDINTGTNVEITGCVNNGKIAGNVYSGGILGAGYNTLFYKDNVNKGEISGGKYVGDLIGYDGHITYVIDNEVPDTTPDDKPGTSEDETTSNKPKDDTPKNDTKVDNNKNNTPTPTKVSKPKKMKIKSAKNLKGKKIKVTWKKVKNIQGYRVRYSTNKKFKKATVKTVSKKKTSLTIKKLKKKTYYIQICAYKKVNGKTYAGSWSTKKTVKVRK